MLTELYIEALMVDAVLADLVWEAWDAGVMGDQLAAMAWLLPVPGRYACVTFILRRKAPGVSGGIVCSPRVPRPS